MLLARVACARLRLLPLRRAAHARANMSGAKESIVSVKEVAATRWLRRAGQRARRSAVR